MWSRLIVYKLFELEVGIGSHLIVFTFLVIVILTSNFNLSIIVILSSHICSPLWRLLT